MTFVIAVLSQDIEYVFIIVYLCACAKWKNAVHSFVELSGPWLPRYRGNCMVALNSRAWTQTCNHVKNPKQSRCFCFSRTFKSKDNGSVQLAAWQGFFLSLNLTFERLGWRGNSGNSSQQHLGLECTGRPMALTSIGLSPWKTMVVLARLHTRLDWDEVTTLQKQTITDRCLTRLRSNNGW